MTKKKGDDRVSPRTGRPTENPKQHRESFRLSDSDIQMLEFCAKKTNMTKTEVIRAGTDLVKKILDEVDKGVKNSMIDIIKERQRKVKKILELYRKSTYRQEDVAKELGIPIEIVRKVTRYCNFEHGKEKSIENPNNLNEGQTINIIIDYNQMGYLDLYNF